MIRKKFFGGIEMKRGTFQLMKSVNKSIVLNKIRTGAPISRSQIAKETKLTPPTVSGIVKDFLEKRIVVEKESGESLGGRKPIMLHINHKAFSIIGVDAGPEQIVAVVTDLSGEILKRVSIDIEKPLDNRIFIRLLKKCINQLIEKLPNNIGEILGIGVAMHGVVDAGRGISLVSPNLGLTDIPIKEELEESFDLTVKVENDARLMALGESWFGGHGKLDSIIAVNIGRGVGSGIILDGKLYHGAQDIAGELGHMVIDIHGKTCECGNRGCLQTLTTGSAIAKLAQKKLSDQGNANEDSFKLSGESVYALAKAGNKLYEDVLKKTGEYIGIGLTNLIHIMNPDKIVLGGGVMNSKEFILPAILQTVGDRALTEEVSKTKIVVTQLGKDATLLGAIAQFLVEVYE